MTNSEREQEILWLQARIARATNRRESKADLLYRMNRLRLAQIKSEIRTANRMERTCQQIAVS